MFSAPLNARLEAFAPASISSLSSIWWLASCVFPSADSTGNSGETITFRHASSCANKTPGSKPRAPPDRSTKKTHRKKRRKYLNESAVEEHESPKKRLNFIPPQSDEFSAALPKRFHVLQSSPEDLGSLYTPAAPSFASGDAPDPEPDCVPFGSSLISLFGWLPFTMLASVHFVLTVSSDSSAPPD